MAKSKKTSKPTKPTEQKVKPGQYHVKDGMTLCETPLTVFKKALLARETAKRKSQDRKFRPPSIPPLVSGEQDVRIPDLIEKLSNPDAGLEAVEELVKFGEAAVPALCEVLHDEDTGVRIISAVALAHIGPAAKAAVPALWRTVREDQDIRVRCIAAVLLSKLDYAADELISPLCDGLTHDDVEYKRYCAWHLRTFEGRASEAVPKLSAFREDCSEDQGVRDAAAGTLPKIDQRYKPPATEAPEPQIQLKLHEPPDGFRANLERSIDRQRPPKAARPDPVAEADREVARQEWALAKRLQQAFRKKYAEILPNQLVGAVAEGNAVTRKHAIAILCPKCGKPSTLRVRGSSIEYRHGSNTDHGGAPTLSEVRFAPLAALDDDGKIVVKPPAELAMIPAS